MIFLLIPCNFISMDIEEILALQLNFFREEELKKEIVERSKIVELEPGSVILNEGAYVKIVPILLKGLVKVVNLEKGKEILLYYIYPLESCIVSIHCGIMDARSSVKAVTEDASSALVVPSSAIGEWQRKYPSFNEFVMGLYQKRFEDVLDAFNAMAFQSVDHRILSYLGSKSNALESKKIHMTHQELGDELGTARETVSRILKKLELEEKLKLGRGVIELL